VNLVNVAEKPVAALRARTFQCTDYAVNNSEVSAPVDQWHLNKQSRAADTVFTRL